MHATFLLHFHCIPLGCILVHIAGCIREHAMPFCSMAHTATFTTGVYYLHLDAYALHFMIVAFLFGAFTLAMIYCRILCVFCMH